jgi:hypothetical protein
MIPVDVAVLEIAFGLDQDPGNLVINPLLTDLYITSFLG